MKLTVNINPKDVIAVTHADDGRAVLSFGLETDGGCNVEIALTVEEKADDVIRAMEFEDAVASDFAEFDKLKNPDFEMGGRIKQRLEELGMSQRELAKACKVTEVSMSRYVSGDRTPKGPIISQIARTLGVTSDWLLGMK
jgi:DNA-binding XRE family transcriptional regulator